MFTSTLYKNLWIQSKTCVRFKHRPNHWSVLKKKNFPTDKALEHFDDFYKQIFTAQWPIIREGLLGKQKYVAVVNNFSDTERITTEMENNGALNIRRLFTLEKEYIREKLEKNKRLSRLEKIWKTDVESNRNVQSKADSETEDKGVIDNSLEGSLKLAEYDERRLVDAKSALSAEILHEFVPATKIKGKEDFIPESTHYKFYDNSGDFAVNIEREFDIHFPEHLNVYCFEEGNVSDFEPAKRGSTGVLDYYCMDGASILPVLALDLRPGNRVLDMCASPGGKSLLALQTLYPDNVICNDVSASRVKRIRNVLHQFLYDLDEKWIKTDRVKVTHYDGRDIPDKDFDRILVFTAGIIHCDSSFSGLKRLSYQTTAEQLGKRRITMDMKGVTMPLNVTHLPGLESIQVDVPCTTDRHSLIENDNNIFKPSRVKERLQLPELQCQLLVQALKIVMKGGVVVYSTCSLSPIQNDGVVHMALKQIWEETNLEFVVRDLSPALVQTRSVFKLASRKLMKYGHLVIPDIQQNYGPMYFCKLERIK